MMSLWNDTEAAKFSTLLEQHVYSSRLLGRDPSLVLHGGGNTSVKAGERKIFGDEGEILHVKGRCSTPASGRATCARGAHAITE